MFKAEEKADSLKRVPWSGNIFKRLREKSHQRRKIKIIEQKGWLMIDRTITEPGSMSLT